MVAAPHWQMLRTQACTFHDPLEIPRSADFRGRFVKILVIEIFSSVLGLFGLIIGLLLSSGANDFK